MNSNFIISAVATICITTLHLSSCKTIENEMATHTPIVIQSEDITIPGTDVTFTMNLLPEGEFYMGNDIHDNEGPSFSAEVESFWIGTHEVSFDEYKIFRKKNLDLPSDKKPDWDADAISRPSPPYEDPTFGMGESGFPAVSMTQLAALQYCKWLSDKTGEFYRLPSEMEWEYSCKAGGDMDVQADLDAYAWHSENSSEKYQQIGKKKANAWGLFDMLGNASEWTLDQYQEGAYTYLASTPEKNAWVKPTSLHPRTVRGGSWDDEPSKSRCDCRIRSSSKWKDRDPQIPKSFWWNTDSPFVGFRIVKPAVAPSAEEQKAFWELVLGG